MYITQYTSTQQSTPTQEVEPKNIENFVVVNKRILSESFASVTQEESEVVKQRKDKIGIKQEDRKERNV